MSQAFYQYGFGLLTLIFIVFLYVSNIATLKHLNKVYTHNSIENRVVILYSTYGFIVTGIIGFLLVPMLALLLGLNWFTTIQVLYVFLIFLAITMYRTFTSLGFSMKLLEKKDNIKFKPNQEKLIDIKKYLIYYTVVFVLAFSYNLFFVIVSYTDSNIIGNTYGYDILNLGILIVLTNLIGSLNKGITKKMLAVLD